MSLAKYFCLGIFFVNYFLWRKCISNFRDSDYILPCSMSYINLVSMKSISFCILVLLSLILYNIRIWWLSMVFVHIYSRFGCRMFLFYFLLFIVVSHSMWFVTCLFSLCSLLCIYTILQLILQNHWFMLNN